MSLDQIIDLSKTCQLNQNKLISQVFMYLSAQKYPDPEINLQQIEDTIQTMCGNPEVNLIRIKIDALGSSDDNTVAAPQFFYIKEDDLSNETISLYRLNESLADLEIGGFVSNRSLKII